MDLKRTIDHLMISSLELMERTKISRATLNNYIKLGILPKPIVTAPNDMKIRTKKIGYYPSSVLEKMKMVKIMKQEGLSILQIANKIQGNTAENSTDTIPVFTGESIVRNNNADEKYQRWASKNIDNIELRSECGDASDYTFLNNIRKQIEIRQKAINDLIYNGEVIPVAFSVLCAKLQDANHIKSDLLRNEYDELMTGLIEMTDDVFQNFFGLYGRSFGFEILYYLIKNDFTDYLMNSILCAIKLRNRIKLFNEEMKRKKNWHGELFLNIGIADDFNKITPIPSLHGIEFCAYGNAQNCASELSSYATDGSIWSTKNLIQKLKSEQQKKLLFGIQMKKNGNWNYKEKHFIRIKNASDVSSSCHNNQIDISDMPITEVFDILS
ncbi:MAG: hypothetical protein JW925_12915 [Syntrophaceae bacterium]|nr:hypothetical protein [Syntrophaceae bacterium]